LYFFLARVVSSLVYPNLLGNKRLGCCCCITLLLCDSYLYYLLAAALVSDVD
jgi:hypothetical protein